jgi:hypothetical protein
MDIPYIIYEKASQMKDKELEDYIIKVNTLLETMKPGDRLDIIRITKSDTRDLFIETVKLFMREHEWQYGLSFAGGFNELRKYDLDFIKHSNKKNVTL